MTRLRDVWCGSVTVDWWAGSRCLAFEMAVRFGAGGLQVVRTRLRLDDLQAAAAILRGTAEPALVRSATIKRGRGEQKVPIPIPRATVLALADALAGVSEKDAGHRMWHYDHPDSVYPCGQCPAGVYAAARESAERRRAFVDEWAQRLVVRSVGRREVEALLAAYDREIGGRS